ncbi:hypothetical protein EDD86DRAFT_259970 [Gorgonomyces haynaldii]|nr:hypothetical protein EDD86DRAFT_259970 [Gorgonomyces haynaldii]
MNINPIPMQSYIKKHQEIYKYRTNTNGGLLVRPQDKEIILRTERIQDLLVETQFRQHTAHYWPDNQRIAMITYLINRKHQDVNMYTPYVHLTISNLQYYAQKYGYPFYYLNGHLVEQNDSGFWAKLDIIKYYLTTFKRKLDWILYTDNDVLILNDNIPLEAFIQPCASHHHFIGVLEPGHLMNYNVSVLIRSGFFMIRNSPEGRQFINDWIGTYDEFKSANNPEQTALENMFVNPRYKDLFCVHTSMSMHSYNNFYRDGMFSVHFPSPMMKQSIPQFFQHYLSHQKDFLWDTIANRN